MNTDAKHGYRVTEASTSEDEGGGQMFFSSSVPDLRKEAPTKRLTKVFILYYVDLYNIKKELYIMITKITVTSSINTLFCFP